MEPLVYSTDAGVIAIAGQMAIDLRTDDVPDFETQMGLAHDYATGRIDFYCAPRYSQQTLSQNQWVGDVANLLALRWLCLHRLNDLPKAVELEWKDRQAELELIRKKQADVPRAPRCRRPVTVTNYTDDLRRENNQIRVDRPRTTGVAKGYVRPTDPTSPDER